MVYGLSFYLALIEEPDAAEYFKYIYIKYQRQMYQSARTILQNHTKSEDAVHNAFFKLASDDKRLIQLMKYKYTEEEGFFLLMVTRRCALTMKDTAAEKHEELSDFEEDLTGKYYDNPNFKVDKDLSDAIVADENSRELKLAMTYLSEEYSNLIMMIYYYEFSIEQIMEDTGWDRQTVYVKKHRALMKLRESMEEIKKKGIFGNE